MYRRREIKALVDGYLELRGQRSTYGSGLRTLLHLADLERAIRKLPPAEYQAILIHGLLRHTFRDASVVLGVSRSTLYERYESGLSWLAHFLNGEHAEQPDQ